MDYQMRNSCGPNELHKRQTVQVTADVLQVFLNHAHSTEREEIIGLLLGDIVELGEGQRKTRIYRIRPQKRVDRRRDRVEVGEEDILACQMEAEAQQEHAGVACRVVGWYHSHPKMVVMPSIVDLRYQDRFQMLDPGFVGLIASVFNEQNAAGKVQLTAFQASGGGSSFRGGGSSSRGGGDSPLRWERVPLTVEAFTPMPPRPPGQIPDALLVQRVAFFEEDELFREWKEKATGQGPAAEILVTTTYQKVLMHILEVLLRPSRHAVEARRHQQRRQAEQLEHEIAALKRTIREGGTGDQGPLGDDASAPRRASPPPLLEF